MNGKAAAAADERVLLLAPTGKDASLAVSALGTVGIDAVICRSMDEVEQGLGMGAGAIVIAQEALRPDDVRAFTEQLAQQAPWSDVPIVFLCAPGEDFHTSRRIVELLQPAGNLTLLERPLKKFTLISVVQMALRARRRQYQVRDLLGRLEESQARLYDKIKDLEQFEQAVVGRELKMIELEKEIEELRRALRQQRDASEVPTSPVPSAADCVPGDLPNQ